MPGTILAAMENNFFNYFFLSNNFLINLFRSSVASTSTCDGKEQEKPCHSWVKIRGNFLSRSYISGVRNKPNCIYKYEHFSPLTKFL